MITESRRAHHNHEHGEECHCDHDHHDHSHEEDCHCGHDHHHHDHAQGEACHCEHNHEHHTHNHEDAAGKTKIYYLENLGCAHCASKMEDKINALPGVNAATITYATKQLRVTAKNPDRVLDEIRKICTSIESQVVVIERDKNNGKEEDTQEIKKKNDERWEFAELVSGSILFLIGLLAHRFGLDSVGILAVYVVGYLILGRRILLEACKNIRKGHFFDENFLMTIATLGAFVIEKYPEAIGVMLFYRVGTYFENKAVERSRGQIMNTLDLCPEKVNVLVGGAIRVLPVEEAQIGDVILIRPGDRIPLDCVIVEGRSRLDTSPITGEPIPMTVEPGDHVVSGCVNQGGQLKMRVEKNLSESLVSRILDSVENAAARKPKIDRFITRFSKVYTPIVVIAAAVVAIIPSLFTGDWNYWIYTAISFLIISCPCALVLSVPLAFFSGIGAGSKKGILFKSGVSMEMMADLKAVVMDKTGTITQGNFKLQQILSFGSYNEAELLQICAGCEKNSTHPIAISIVNEAHERNLCLQEPNSMEEIAGFGVVAQMEEGQVLCGNQKLMRRHDVDIENICGTAYGAEVYLAVNGKLEGYLLISDNIKENAASAISRLKAMGLHTAMLTGDSERGAKAVAGEIGIGEVFSKLLPQDKVEILSEIRTKRGPVMFVGDGLNDAPVLAGADVGAAMGSGADASIEAADVVFMTSSVESIPEAVSIAQKTNRIAVQNVVFALIIKVAVMILGLCGHANMWMAVFADTGVAMLCVLNSIRLLYKK